MAVLAEHPDDAACGVAAEVVLGSPFVAADLRAFAARCDVVTFDHEQVDLDLVAELAAEGTVVRPGRRRRSSSRSTRPTCAPCSTRPACRCPPTSWWTRDPDALDAVEAFAADHGWPVMLKAARGGYDGKGVWPVGRPRRGGSACLARVRGRIVVEELLPLEAELAVMVARRPSGASAAWPAVETAQVGGVCREVLVPGRLDADSVEAASALGQKVAEIAGARRRHGGGALLVGRPAAGQRGGDPTAQLGPLDDRGCGDVPVREPRAGGARPAPRARRRPSTPRWPASTSSAAPTAPTRPRCSPAASPSRAPTSTSMASTPDRDANWGT